MELYRFLARFDMAQESLSRRALRTWLMPVANELQHDLAPVRAGAMLGQIETLPGAERELAVDHRHLQRDAVYHGLHVRRHIVGPFHIVDPAGVSRRDAIERGEEIGLHVRIGILLDHKGCRGMA